MSASAILAGAAEGSRISAEEAMEIYLQADLLELGEAARKRTVALHGDSPVTYLIDRNINYTNVCENRCRFCAFYRQESDADAFLLSHEDILDKVAEAVGQGATQIMLQGGLHPALDLSWFTSLFRTVKKQHPVRLHSLSPPEVLYLAGRESLSPEETLRRLAEAGLDSLPGGGAEILVDRVRHRISPRKIGSRQWLEVMRTAHRLGMPTTATMMFGAGEQIEDRVEHLVRIRVLQDETGGFLSFIPWTFQPANTDLAGGGTSALEYLRTLALSRLFLDNIRNVQGSWVTQGPEIGQMSLEFGANDLGSIMLEENVVRAAGTSHRLSREAMERLITSAGRSCAQRDTFFHIIRLCRDR